MITINNKAGIPKYKQIVFSIEKAIIRGTLKKGDQIPSLNSIKIKHNLSRDTVLTAFNELKSRGIIESIVGKGYYVSSENVSVTKKIFLLFDELNSFKEDLYNAFLNKFEENTKIDIYFHHFNQNVFDSTIVDNVGDYNHYIIMPANLKNTNESIKKLPENQVYILDQIHEDLKNYPAIYQNFENDILKNLTKALPQIKKYEKLFLLFSKDKQPQGLLNGFVSFCQKNNISFSVIDSLENKDLSKNELYIIPDDKSLLKIIKRIKRQNLKLAKDIGIISYNDTLLKEIVEGGITTISTDFKHMGERLAEMIINNENTKVENPNNLILRNSL